MIEIGTLCRQTISFRWRYQPSCLATSKAASCLDTSCQILDEWSTWIYGIRACYNQEDQGHKDDPIPEPSNCKVRRFEMMKYSFDDDEEYITIKESEYIKHSKDSLDAYQELLRLIDDGWVMTTPEEA
ncbi:hypothetical protein Tco_0152737 [Tanacetum coccineum]